jgi:predicted transcriptional regulator
MNDPRLGERELDIMQALWDRGEGTVADVHQALAAMGRTVAYTTVQTMLNRLEDKGLLRRDRRGRAHLYRPVMKEPAAASVALRRVIDRFFGGDPAQLATHLVGGAVPARDLDRIQALIEERRRGGRKR